MKRMIWLAIVMGIGLSAIGARAQNVEFNYNGMVRVQGVPYDGVGYFKFSIVNPNGEITYWANDGATLDGTEPTSQVTVVVDDGFFSVNIGDDDTTGMAPLNPAVFTGKENVFLRVWFSDGVHGFEELNPKRRIVNPALLASQELRTPVDIYVNGTTGDDENNGFAPDKAKKTIQAAIDIVPKEIEQPININVADGIYRETVNIQGFNAQGLKGGILKIIGDPDTIPSDTIDPGVIVSGSDNDITPVRPYGIHIRNCQFIQVIGIKVQQCTAYDFFAGFVGEVGLIKCKAANSDIYGFTGVQGRIDFTDCVSVNNGYDGFYITQYTTSNLVGCLSKGNSQNGLRVTSGTVWFGDGSQCQSNGQSGALVTENSLLKITSGGATFGSNSQYGVFVSYGAILQNSGGATYSPANGSGSTGTSTGGAVY
jgi:hypothetical protein